MCYRKHTTASLLFNNKMKFNFQMALVSPTEEQFDLLQKKITQRLEEGRGETIFDIGVGEGNELDKLHHQ